MKKAFFFCVIVMFCGQLAISQETVPALDKSPLDMSYYPADYPLLRIQGKTSDPAIARVIYSRPKKEGRAVFGNLVEYGKLWRLGANEATEIEFFRPVIIGQKKVAKGRYTLYAVVNEKSWTFIINKDTDIWGSFNYKQANDIVRVDVPVLRLDQPLESMAMMFEKSGSGINLVIAWENTRVALPITL